LSVADWGVLKARQGVLSIPLEDVAVKDTATMEDVPLLAFQPLV
jgi:hypothetical protein